LLQGGVFLEGGDEYRRFVLWIRKNMAIVRKVFFYIFAAIYVVFCPLMILYAIGYLYSPGMAKGVVKTGLIAVATVPSQADIFMNNSRYAKLSPAVINELLPGEYSIRVELEGYQVWEETVPVEAEKATVLDKILLIPLQWKIEEFLHGKIKDIIPVPETDFFLAKQGPKLIDFFLIGCKEEKYWPLVKEDSLFRELKVEAYSFVAGSNSGIFRGSIAEEEKVVQIIFSGEDNQTRDITGLFPKGAREVKWQTRAENKLFVLQEENLTRVDLDTGAVYPEYIQNIKGYGLAAGQLYLLNSENLFLETDYNGTGKNFLLEDKKLGETLFGQTKNFDITAVSEDTFLFLGSGGELLSNRLPYRFADDGVIGIKCAEASLRVLLWQKNRIGILDFETEKTQNTAFEKGPSLRWVHTEGSNITQAFWVYKESHILFTDQNKVFLVEIEEYDGFNSKQIFTIKRGTSLCFSEDTGKVYYISPSAKEGVSSGVIVFAKGSGTAAFPQIKEEDKEEQRDE